LKLGYKRPIIIHRAILGSLERFIGLLCEKTMAKWPFWLSPRQIIICTVNDKCIEYAQSLALRL